MRTRRHRTGAILVLATVALLRALASAHGPVGQTVEGTTADPELFSGWQVWVHLVVQWGHLLGLPLWLGVLVAAWVFRALALETLLLAGWAVLLLQVATGTYNMEYSAGIPTAPSLLQWAVVGAYDFGRSYTAVLGIKQGLYGLAVLVTLLVTALHLHRAGDVDRARLRQGYLATQIALGVLIALATTGVLVLHEAAAVGWWQIYRTKGELVTDGLYGLVRHPQYLALILGVLAFLIQWPTLPMQVMAPVLVVAYLRLAKREEQALAATFGHRYRLYQQRVPGFCLLGGD